MHTPANPADDVPDSKIAPDSPPFGAVAVDTHDAMHTWRFWAIIASLSITGLKSAIEGTIITSALPTISQALSGGKAYLWVPNAFILAQVATLPLFAQASNVFGRRNLLLGAVLLFTLGSALSAAASSMGILIAARTTQGLGGGGINLLIETVVIDIVPLRERGNYTSLIMIGATIGATLGPFMGGLLTDRASWRWVCLYINVPVGAAAFVCLFTFLRVNYQRRLSWTSRLARVDFAGNAIFVGAIVAMLIALGWGGTVFQWRSFHIVVPLVLGFLGLLFFTAYEWTPRLCPEPSFPRQMVSKRTSATALVLIFLHALLTYWTSFFLPVYFQAVRARSPIQSSVDTLPTSVGGLFFAVVGGLLLSRTGHYKPLHLCGFAILVVSFGLLSLLDAQSSRVAYVCFQLICAAGSGLVMSVLLPAVQAPLDESAVATATGLYSFARYFRCVWGVAIPSTIINNEFRRLGRHVANRDIAVYLTGGRAYQYVTRAFVLSMEDMAQRHKVVQVFAKARSTVWTVGIAFAGLALVATLLERQIGLRKEPKSEFGMERRARDTVGEPFATPTVELASTPASRGGQAATISADYRM